MKCLISACLNESMDGSAACQKHHQTDRVPRWVIGFDADTNESLITDADTYLIIARTGPLGERHVRQLVDTANSLSDPRADHRIAALLIEYEDEDDCNKCEDCGELVMCRFHSVLSVLYGRTQPTDDALREAQRRAGTVQALSGSAVSPSASAAYK